MNDPSEKLQPSAISPPFRRNTLWLLLVLSLLAAATVAWLVFRPERGETEVIETLLEGEAALAADIYRHEVVDAVNRRDVKALVGRRYRVRITDESDEGAAGVAKIGGLVTFVSGARKGETVVIEITRVKRNVAEAVRIRGLESVAASDSAKSRRSADSPTNALQVGDVYSGVAKELGKEGNGVIWVEGKVVFVQGARLGEHVQFEITENRKRFARGRVIDQAPVPEEISAGATATAPVSGETARAEEVQPGRIFDVMVTEADRKNPEHDGVTRIGGLVVFVAGGRPDERVRIRIRKRMTTFAFADVLERLGPETSQPAAWPPEGP